MQYSSHVWLAKQYSSTAHALQLTRVVGNILTTGHSGCRDLNAARSFNRIGGLDKFSRVSMPGKDLPSSG